MEALLDPHFILFYFLAVLCGMRDPSSPTRDRTHAPHVGSPESQPLDLQGSPNLHFKYQKI